MDKPLLDYQSAFRSQSKARIDVTIYLRCYYGGWVVALVGWIVGWVIDFHLLFSGDAGFGKGMWVAAIALLLGMLLFAMSLWVGGLCLSRQQISVWAYLVRILAVVLALSALFYPH